MGNKKIKNIQYQIHTVESTYDSDLDDWMLDKFEPTQIFVNLSAKTSNEQICTEMQLKRHHYESHISKNEIYVVNKNNKKPKYCLKKV